MDFFAALLDRSQDQASVLQRRQPSRFEPLAWQTAPVMDIDEAIHQGTESPPSVAQAPSSPAAPVPFEEPETPRGRETGASEAAGRMVPGSPPPSVREPDAGHGELNYLEDEIAGLSQSIRRLERLPGEASVAESPAPGEPLLRLEKETIIVERPVPDPPTHPGAVLPPSGFAAALSSEVQRYASPKGTAREEVRREARQPAEVERHMAPQPAVRKASHTDGPAPGAAIVPRLAVQPAPGMPSVPSASRRENRAQASAPVQAPPTTVHVSIGRIEIRATPAAAKPARSQAAVGPRLSLDDYLKTRNGGGR